MFTISLTSLLISVWPLHAFLVGLVAATADARRSSHQPAATHVPTLPPPRHTIRPNPAPATLAPTPVRACPRAEAHASSVGTARPLALTHNTLGPGIVRQAGGAVPPADGGQLRD